MNERIKEFIMESVNFRLDPDSNAYEAQVCPEDLEYLVELIVRECANVAAEHDALDIYEEIREHFGVEE